MMLGFEQIFIWFGFGLMLGLPLLFLLKRPRMGAAADAALH
jgi:hypothetical protein